jgi:hypothetical protein
MNKLLIGCDPEVFVKKSSNNQNISGHDLGILGTKYEPQKMGTGAILVDGVALEFNIDPTEYEDIFIKRCTDMLNCLQMRVSMKDDDYIINISSVARFNPKYFKELPEYVKALGCEPDFDAYTQNVNAKPNAKMPFRTAAGHIHIGWTEDKDIWNDVSHFNDCLNVVKQLDSSLYVGSLLWDKDVERRELYGKRGSFRPKSYGVEYRPLSNQWLTDTNLMGWVFDTTKKAVKMLDDDVKLYEDVRLGEDFNERKPMEGYLDLKETYHFRPLPKQYVVET